MIEIGELAPDFTLPDDQGRPFTLSEALKESRVMLYFYPKDFTLICTAQAKMCRNDGARLRRAGIRVVGVSHQSVASHQSFKANHGLDYTLLADVEKRVIRLYGATTWFGTARDTYLIDRTGKVLDRARAHFTLGAHHALIDRAVTA